MKLLIVGFTASIHVARWINQLEGCGWEIALFPCVDNGATNDQLRGATVYHTFYGKYYNKNKNVRIKGVPTYSHLVAFGLRLILEKIFPNYQKNRLRRLIKRFKPDVIHSMEIQYAGGLVQKVKDEWRGEFPRWVATNWGSDIYLFSRLPENKKKTEKILASCDFYSCECNRDVKIAREWGFKKEALPVFPNTGGFDLKKLEAIRKKTKPSERKAIIVKGYQGWAGRAMVALHALDRCGKLVDGFELIIYSIQPETGVDMAARLLALRHNMKLTIVPLRTPHFQILRYQSRSRISIGLSISDAISTMVLEAVVTGSFPIQSDTSCADEWVKHGETGMIVPPEDPEIVEKTIRRALTDDKLVDSAARENWKVAKRELDEKIIRRKILDFYDRVKGKVKS